MGATIHRITKGLDNGPILFHCLPKLQKTDNSFDFSMRSVLSAHKGIKNFLNSKNFNNYEHSNQDKLQEIRYTKNKDFNDEVAYKFLKRNYDIQNVTFNYPKLTNQFFY